ncbi:ECF transporter S component [Actinomycetaceae bacterium TAE3-ERU4]|nr:ECF transporter S component [Actinomycetaceae bacterium TAE3-ERU4]
MGNQVNSSKNIRKSSRHGLNNSVLGTRNLMMTAALGIVGSIIVVPLSYAELGTAATPASILMGTLLMGAWVIAYLLPAVIVKRPGTILVASMVMAVVSLLTTPMGPVVFVGYAMGALFLEIPLAIMLYRHWEMKQFLIASAVFGAINGIMYVAWLNAIPTPIKIVSVILSVVSALVGGFIAVAIGKAAARAGVGTQN